MVSLNKFRVPVENVRKFCPPEQIQADFELKGPIDFVGQERAIKALKRALAPESRFHVLLATSAMDPEIIRRTIRIKLQESGAVFDIKDWCYLYNFDDPESPALLVLKRGEGKKLQEAVEKIKGQLTEAMPVAFDSSAFKTRRNKIYEDADSRGKQLMWQFFEEVILAENWQERWLERGFTIFFINEEGQICQRPIFKEDFFSDEEWASLNPGIKDALLHPEEVKISNEQLIGHLPSKPRKKYEDAQKELRSDWAKVEEVSNRAAEKIGEEAIEKLGPLVDGVRENVTDTVFREHLAEWQENRAALAFLEKLKRYATENHGIFLPLATKQVMTPFGPGVVPEDPNEQEEKDRKRRPFDGVNLFVDNSGNGDEPPIIIAQSSTHSDLFGKIEKEAIVFGRHKDETRPEIKDIKAGAFHKAQGGFIILDLTNIILRPALRLSLERTLKERDLRIREPQEEFGVSYPGKTLCPEPMPLDLKVIATIQPWLYYLLWQFPLERELMDLFEISALFGSDIEYTKENASAYACWIERYAQSKNFGSVAPEARMKIIEHLMREAENQTRILWDIEKLKNLIKEAHLCSLERGGAEISQEDVRQAVEDRFYRSSLIQERLREMIKRGVLIIDTGEEKEPGQINGLAVFSLDDTKFGLPTRITATTSRGEKGITNIEREADMSGKTHSKGVETLAGFFRTRYGRDKPLNFDARIGFEQTYSGVDGDSASAAELFAIISSLAELPLRQDIATTGSVDQKGNIQAIGGVNEKIEGFYAVCGDRGLTYRQGVMIPASNVQHLMLKEKVVQAVKDSCFHIFSINSVQEGLEILTGVPMEEIDRRVNEKLKKWSRKSRGKRFLFFG